MEFFKQADIDWYAKWGGKSYNDKEHETEKEKIQYLARKVSYWAKKVAAKLDGFTCECGSWIKLNGPGKFQIRPYLWARILSEEHKGAGIYFTVGLNHANNFLDFKLDCQRTRDSALSKIEQETFDKYCDKRKIKGAYELKEDSDWEDLITQTVNFINKYMDDYFFLLEGIKEIDIDFSDEEKKKFGRPTASTERKIKYWRIYTDKDARLDNARTCDIWYEEGMAFTGDKVEKLRHADIMEMLSVDDGIFMHHGGRGIVGYGTVTKEWDGKPYESKDKKLYIDGKADEIYEYRIEVKWLPEFDNRDKFSGAPVNSVSKWFPSYILRDNYYNEVNEETATKILSEIRNPAFAGIPESDKEIDSIETFYEGTNKEAVRKFYERNPGAREKCLAHWGFDCCICGFNFEAYGNLGKGYIHVHHIVPISVYDEEHPIDPVKDLCPVCPNCHAMLHRKSPPYTIDEIKLKIVK